MAHPAVAADSNWHRAYRRCRAYSSRSVLNGPSSPIFTARRRGTSSSSPAGDLHGRRGRSPDLFGGRHRVVAGNMVQVATELAPAYTLDIYQTSTTAMAVKL